MYYNLIEEIRTDNKNTQNYILAELFENNHNTIVDTTQITVHLYDEYLKRNNKPLKDLQRGVRTFIQEVGNRFGISKPTKDTYKYTPILKSIDIHQSINDNKRNFNVTVKKDIIKKYGSKCALCGRTGTQIDHWRPHSCGGMTTIENAVLLCDQCNITKKNLHPLSMVSKYLHRVLKIESDYTLNKDGLQILRDLQNEIEELIKHNTLTKQKID